MTWIAPSSRLPRCGVSVLVVLTHSAHHAPTVAIARCGADGWRVSSPDFAVRLPKGEGVAFWSPITPPTKSEIKATWSTRTVSRKRD